LDLDVMRLLDVFFDVEGRVLEGRGCLGRGESVGRLDLLGFLHLPHPLAAAARARLQKDGVTDLFGDLFGLFVILQRILDARHHRHSHFLGGAPPGDLVAQHAHGIPAGADELDPLFAAVVGEVGVLGEKAVAGVDGVGTGLFGDLEDLLRNEVTLFGRGGADQVGLVREADVERSAVDFRVDRDRLDADLSAGPDDPKGDFSSIGDENFFEHGRKLTNE
jgi:hypothetical protein